MTAWLAVGLAGAATVLYGIHAGTRIPDLAWSERAGRVAVLLLLVALTGAFAHVALTQDGLIWRQWVVVAALGLVAATQIAARRVSVRPDS